MSTLRKIDQVLPDGSIVEDFDHSFSVQEISKLYRSLFGQNVVVDGHQVIISNKVALLTANITYLGGFWESYKKRWQLKSYYPEYVEKNGLKHLKTFYIGIYSYKETLLFVVNDPVSHIGKKVHNSSSHIHIFDLQYALKNGSYRKVDKGGNLLTVMTKANFIVFINNIITGVVDQSAEYYDTLIGYFDSFFSTIKKTWNGLDCYREMAKDHDNNAAQPEWCGFYLEYLFKKRLKEVKTDGILWNSDKKKTGIDLDLRFPKIDWFFGDLKTDNIDNDVLGNDEKTLDIVIEQHQGKIWYVALRFSKEKDSDHNFEVTKLWDSLRGGKYAASGYKDISDRYGKKMKYSITIKSAQILNIDESTYEILKQHPFNQGKNSDEHPRYPKIKINDEIAEAITIYQRKI
jgi:hypothetical protein